ncbi:protein RALF-like 17 [Fagus crenata]|jgi:hypothetical protein|uniref:Phytosulfokine-beta n=1 Tax=Fagus sylvatica TaxID=28930 RepID=A0A2N9FLD3_FAGSY
MAISRSVLLFGLGTLLVCLLLIKVSEADESDHYAPIHVIKHDGIHCDGAHPNNGDQCRNDDDDNEEVDDDVDDTYKVVNKMSVSFSASTGQSSSSEDPSESDATSTEEELNNHMIVLGH